jgi:hypothetical protein
MIRSRAAICDNNLITGQLSRSPPVAIFQENGGV